MKVDSTRRLLFHRVVQGTRIDKNEDTFLLPVDRIAWEGEVRESDVLMRSPTGGAAHIAGAAVEAAERLASLLHRQFHLAPSSVRSDAVTRVLRAAVAVRAGAAESLDAALDQLVETLERSSGVGMVVFAVGGATAEADFVPLGNYALFGHLTSDCENAISDLARRVVGSGLHISSTLDTFWVEDYVAQRNDSYLADEIAGEHKFPMPVLAVCVPAIGVTARFRGLQVAEAILGSLWVCSSIDAWPTWPPWIIGLPTASENPRDPDLDELADGSIVPLQVLQVDAAGTRSGDGFEWRPRNLDVDDAIRAETQGLVNLVADASFVNSDQVGPRLASACRLALHAAREIDPELVALHSTIALESLVGDEEASKGTTRRFVSRLGSLLGDAASTSQLEILYELRSELAHTGRTPRSFEEAAELATWSLDLCRTAIIGTFRLSERQRLRTLPELFGWLDAVT
jgi:hypothetical protein